MTRSVLCGNIALCVLLLSSAAAPIAYGSNHAQTPQIAQISQTSETSQTVGTADSITETVVLPYVDIPASGPLHDAVVTLRQKNILLPGTTENRFFTISAVTPTVTSAASPTNPAANPETLPGGVLLSKKDFHILLWKLFRLPDEIYDPVTFPFPELNIDPNSEEGQALIWWAHKNAKFSMEKTYRSGDFTERGYVALCLHTLYRNKLKCFTFQTDPIIPPDMPVNDDNKALPQVIELTQAVSWCVSNAIIPVFDDQTFRPSGERGRCSEQDAVLILYRFYLHLSA